MRCLLCPRQGGVMTNSTHLRISAAGLVLGSLLFTLGDLCRRLVEPSGTPTPRDVADAVSDHGSLWLLAGILSVVAAFCLVAGVTGPITTASGRGARITTIGALLVGVGAISSVGHTVAFYSPFALYAEAQTSGNELEALDRASESYPLLVMLIVLFIVGMMLGTITLAVGLRRARRVPIWSVVSAVVFVATGSIGGVAAGLLGIVAAMGLFVPAARALLIGPTDTRGAVNTEVATASV